MKKVAFLNPTIPPRVVSLLNKINSDPKIEIHGYFFAMSQKNRAWNLNKKEYEKIKFSYTILKSISVGFGVKDYSNTFFSFDLWNKLDSFNPDIVLIPGWADINSFIAFFWAKIHKKKVVLRTESTQYEKSVLRLVFLPIVKFICNFSDLIIASSNRAKTYTKTLTPDTNVITIYSSFDTVSFAKKVNKLSPNKIKKELGITQKKVVYFNGQSIERKGILPLLTAFSSRELKNIALVLTGSGPLDTVIWDYAQKYSNIYTFGYQKQNKLPHFYCIADIFILPSFQETWGLVTVEAMAAGLPIIISKFAGSSELISKERGFILKNISSASIKKSIMKMTQNKPHNKKQMSKTNLHYAITELSYETISKKFVQAFKTLV